MLLETLFTSGVASPIPAQVFNTTAYTGTGAALTLTDGINRTHGALDIFKSRSAATDWAAYDTARGVQKDMSFSNVSSIETTETQGVTAVSATGVTIGSLAKINTTAATYLKTTFRASRRFFDVVSYTGNGVAGRTIPHNLGITPGMFVVKSRGSAPTDWFVYHRSLGATQLMKLSTTAATVTDIALTNNTAPTASVFTVHSNANVNGSGGTYVAYLFAHDAPGLIQCGTFTANASGAGTATLGWRPQFILLKASSTTGDWLMYDTTRGIVAGADAQLRPNSSGVETSIDIPDLTLTGFTVSGLTASATYVYLAVRE